MPKTKVVDLEILSKFGIQKFFVWGQEEGETFSLQKESLNFELFTRLPSTLPLSLPHGVRTTANVGNGAVSGRRPRASRPGQNCLRAPGFAPTAPPWHLVPATRASGAPPRATTPHAVAVPGRYAVA